MGGTSSQGRLDMRRLSLNSIARSFRSQSEEDDDGTLSQELWRGASKGTTPLALDTASLELDTPSPEERMRLASNTSASSHFTRLPTDIPEGPVSPRPESPQVG